MKKAKLNWLKRLYQLSLGKLGTLLSEKFHQIYFNSTYFRSRYYSDLEELPIYNWWKIHEKKDLTYLLKNKKKLTFHAADIFDKLYSDFISIFGVGDSFKKYLEKVIEIEVAEIDMVLTKDLSMETFIDIMRIELDDLKADSAGGTYMDGVIAVEKNMGFKMDTKKTSVFEYYSYVKSLEKSVINGSKR